MPRPYTFHDQASHPDEWFCSTEQKWKPRSEFNLRDKANGLPQWDCRDCQQKREWERYKENKGQVKNINCVAKLNSREENREYVYNYLYTHPCQDCGASDPRILSIEYIQDEHFRGIEGMNLKRKDPEIKTFVCKTTSDYRTTEGCIKNAVLLHS